MCDIDKDLNLNLIVGFNKDVPLPNLGILNVDKDQVIKQSQVLTEKFLSDMDSDNDDPTKLQKAVEHALRRSIRGVGTSDEMKMAVNYFNLISTLRLAPQSLISLDMIFNVMEAELSPITKTPRDQREVKTGQLFVMSAILCSRIHYTIPTFDTKAFIEKVMTLGQETCFYRGIAFKVLRQLILTAHEDIFTDVILPFILQDIQSEQKSILTYFLLLLGEEKFPSICTAKVIKGALGYKNVLNVQTVQAILDELKKKDGTKSFTFIIPDLCRNLARPEANIEILPKFWTDLSKFVSTETQSKELVTVFFTTFDEFIENLTVTSQIPNMLSRTFVTYFLKPPNDKNCCERRDNSLRKLYSVLEKQKDLLNTTVLMDVIERVLFCPGDFSFEKTTAGKTFIRQVVSLLKKKGVKKLASRLRHVIMGTSLKDEFIDGRGTERPWQNKERIYAVHFLNRLLRHQSVYNKQDFKMEQLTFLTDVGFIAYPIYPGASISVDFAKTVRESLYSAVTHRVPSLSDFQHMFVTIVEHLNSHINQGSKLRVKFTDNMKLAWEKMMSSIKLLDEMITSEDISKFDQPVEPKVVVFHPLFLQLGLLLFKEPNFAMDCLKELQEVYHRTINIPDYDQWTGDFVELLLSLLSRNSQLHRNLIKCIFSHMCVHLTSENIISVLRVLDPRADANLLLRNMEVKYEDSDSEMASDNENDISDEEENSEDESDSDNAESGDDEDEENIEDDEETATDKLRQAVRNALGEAGNSDNESVEVENMDEDEGQRVDKALAKAFAEVRSVGQNKNKKQSATDKALTDFRLRVIDLVEVWLNMQFPKLYDVLDAMLTLLHLYGVCVMDRKQAPLVPRVRACLKKLTSLKKVSDLENVPEEKLAEILSSVIEQENRSPIIYKELTKPIIDCTLIVLRFAKRFHTTLPEAEASSILNVIVKVMDTFFTQRNCPLQKIFFVNILKMGWICNWYLAERLSKYAFASETRPFVRSQALDLLCTFFSNKRLVHNDINKVYKLKLKPIASLIYEKTNMVITEKIILQHKFMVSLQSLIKSIEQCKINDKKDWKDLNEKLSDFMKLNLKKKHEAEIASDDTKTTETNFKKKVFNLSVSSESPDTDGSSELSDESADENKQKSDDVTTSDKTSKKKDKSSPQQEEANVAELNTKAEKSKKRKKKHGKNKADKNVSKMLRIEAGSQGLIDGCFSKLNLPTDIDGDDEYEEEDEDHKDVNGVGDGKKYVSVKEDSSPVKRRKKN